MPKLNAADLDRIYRDADQIDEKVFSEMRSNILLVSGDHYHKKGTKFWNRIRNSKELSEEQKLRLTKNHTENVCNKITECILMFAPRAIATPNNPDEIQDQKTAELNDSVWQYGTKDMGFRQMTRDFCESFVQLGEVHQKTYWDEDAGRLIGYGPTINEEFEEHEQGYYERDEQGNMIPDNSNPIFEGKLKIEEVLGFNILRDPNVQKIEDSEYLIVRKMVSKDVVRKMLENATDDNKKEEVLKDFDNAEESYLVFDGDKAQYNQEKKMVMLREHFYKPCRKYPKGYYYIALQSHVLAEGELPFGIWPFVCKGYNKIKTSARYRSPIKTIRPFQIEINRCASAIATHQITLGDDKLILNHGSKISHGGKLSGVRAISVTGGNDPKILSGRSGEQYLPYMQQQTTELYNVMNIPESDPIKDGQLDPFAMLYISNKNREKFRKYGETFEEFIIETAELYLKLAKHYLDESHIIPMIGKTEMVNIAEFKHTEPNSYRIKIEAISDDSNTMLGKQLSINHMMQYVSKNLDKNQIGMMIRQMPFLNDEEMSQDFTMEYDNCKNDFLAIERGEVPLFNQYDNHNYIINRTSNRMRKADFRFLPDPVKMMYQQYMQLHQQARMQQIQETQQIESGFIPTDGPLVTVDYYVTHPETRKAKRAKFPQRSLEKLEEMLKSQGTDLEKVEQMNQGALAEMAQMQNPNPSGGDPSQGF